MGGGGGERGGLKNQMFCLETVSQQAFVAERDFLGELCTTSQQGQQNQCEPAIGDHVARRAQVEGAMLHGVLHVFCVSRAQENPPLLVQCIRDHTPTQIEAPCGDQTHDHTLTERMLCQLS